MKRSLSQPMRSGITVVVLIAAFLLLQTLGHGKPMPLRQNLRGLPFMMDSWRGEERPFDGRMVEAVGVSDYINRIYFRTAEPAVQVYVGYYASQATGDTIHSPKNCLPGAGWDPVASTYATISVYRNRQIVVNEYVVQKDTDKQLVFYWYQGRGRIIASEYLGKFWMIVDAISRNRTDGALVRVNTPMDDGREKAYARLRDFTKDLFPRMEGLIPE